MLKEYMAIQKNSATRPHLELLEPIQEDNLLHWQAVLLGTADSAYEGGKFHLDIVIPSSYPIQPPTIRFTTKICHPNVHFKVKQQSVLISVWMVHGGVERTWMPYTQGFVQGTKPAFSPEGIIGCWKLHCL